MPLLETPPDPAPPQPSPASSPASGPNPGPDESVRLRTRRFGELDHHELVYLLDQLDDERSRSRFRESIYISLLFYCLLAFVVLYGPRYLWHTPQIIPVKPEQQEDHHVTYLETPPDLQKVLPRHPPPVISDRTHTAQTPHPVPHTPTPEELQAMRRAGEPRPAPPHPQPPTPQPQPRPTPPQPQQQQPQSQPQQQPRQIPQTPRPQPTNIPDAPRPAPTNSSRPNFSLPNETPGQLAAEAGRSGRGLGGDEGANAPSAHNGLSAPVEILSDTLGVDFGPYIRHLLIVLKAAWLPLIPEECNPPLSKEGQTLLRFTIGPDGTLTDLHYEDSTHDVAIDKAAWGAVKSVGRYPPLPKDFHGPELQLRVHFIISRNPEAGGRRPR